MAFLPNDEQARVIEWGSGDIAVAAGAGSGKTAVLSHRIARAVTEGLGGGGPVDVAGVLAVTYTRKAAGELADRVRRALLERGASEAARRVDEAWISTIDGLCGRILRSHALECGVDPAYRTASQVERRRIVDEAFMRTVDEIRESSGLEWEVLGDYGLDRMLGAVPEVYDRVRAMGANVCDIEGVESSRSPREAVAALDIALAGLARALEEGKENRTRSANKEALERLSEWLVRFGHAGDPSALERLMYLLEPSMFNARCDVEDVESVRAAMAELRRAVVATVTAPRIRALIDMVERYGRHYRALEREAGLLDYTEVVERTADLLLQHPEVARALRERFKVMMVDEFQDTNELRLAAMTPLRDDNLCIVGDDKQSIYRFQFADVDVFRRLRAELGGGVTLRRNYRSLPEIIDFVNMLFASESFFGADAEPLQADRTEGSVPWPRGAARVELIEIEGAASSDGGSRSAEATAAAERVAGLVRDGISPNDIVVLLAAMTRSGEYITELERRGVAAVAASGVYLWDSAAVGQVLAYLRLVALPGDDVALLRLLVGPMVSLSDASLATIRGQDGETMLDRVRETVLAAGSCVGVSASERDRLEAFLTSYDRICEESRSWRLVRVIDAVCDSTDFDLALAGRGSRGAREWAEVQRLRRLAAQWDDDESGGIGGFLDHVVAMERVREYGPTAPTYGGQDAVSIMSIHASKGLEFPVVVVGGLGSALVKRTSGAGAVVFDRMDGVPRLALVPPERDGFRMTARETAAQPLIETIENAERSEALRLLYVAFTRARDALVLVGAGVRGSNGLAHETGLGRVLAVLGDPSPGSVDIGSTTVDYRRIAAEEIVSGDETTGRIVIGTARLEQARTAVRAADEVDVACSYETETAQPRSVSYSSLQEYEDCPFSFYARRILGLRKLQGLGASGSRATDVGAAVHEALEQVGDGDVDPADAVRRAVARHRLNAEGYERVSGAVRSFVDSALACEIEHLERVMREAPIVVRLGRTDLVGNIDLIGWRGSRATVVDYKTGRDRIVSRGESRLCHYRLQAECYALAAFEAGATEVEMRFVFVEQGAEEERFTFGPTDAARIREMLESTVRRMGEGHYAPLDEYDETLCTKCPAYGSPCPVRRPSRSA